MSEITGVLIVSLDNELRTAFGLLKHGLASLQTINAANAFYPLPLLLLANGSERLCKCVLILKHESEHDTFPPQKQLERWGHDVSKLVSTIAAQCYPNTYLQRQIAVDDRAFLTSDALLQEVLGCLSYYGKKGRYYDLDVICGQQFDNESPESVWQRLEMSIVREDPALKKLLSDPCAGNKLRKKINRRLQVVLERFIRALCHQFTLGSISEEGNRFTCVVGDFLFLRDEDLGKSDYRELLWQTP